MFAVPSSCPQSQNTGLLIFCRVVKPRNSGKSTKSQEIHKNTLNHVSTRYLKLINWGCVIAVNLQIYLETSSPQQANNILKLPHVNYVAKNWALVMTLKALPLAHLKQQMIISVSKT